MLAFNPAQCEWRLLTVSLGRETLLDAMFNAFGNATQVPPKRWRDEPTTRGTWNILSSCLITLSLCLWTTLHLNIPRHKEGAWRQKIRKTGWLLLGLLAPEMLAYTAWYQYRAAHKLDTVMRRKLGQGGDRTCAQRLAALFTRSCHCRNGGAGRRTTRKTSDVELADRETTTTTTTTTTATGRDTMGSPTCAANRRHRWTTAHSYYALMGGFVFDTSDEDVNFLPNGRSRLTLTPAGLFYLLGHELELLPNISEEHICDKSKASNLAKTLVCLQALWFCVQFLVRLAQGLAVSLLELNVFGHAICALLMYLLWWDKPLDIEEPTVLSGNMAREMCALMCMRSFPGASSDEKNGLPKLPELPYGVRYGSTRQCNIAEVSANHKVDGAKSAKTKWHMLDKLLVIGEILVSAVFPSRPRILECRLHWTAASEVIAQPERFCQYTAYPVDLDYPSVAVGPKERTTSLPSLPGVAAGHSLHARNAGAKITQPLPPGPSITTNRIGIDGFCLTLGRWLDDDGIEKDIYAITNADLFVPRRPQPDYAPISVTLSRADVVRWRLCARALQRYCPQPRWCVESGAPSHQLFPAYRSVYDRAPNWPSSQQLKFTKENSGQPLLAIWLGFSFAGLVYGGLHLLAWDAPFPSRFRQTLWRSSGVLLASSGFVCTLLVSVFASAIWGIGWVGRTSFWQHLKARLGDRYEALANFAFTFGFWVGLMVSVGPFTLVYLHARVNLVVESFLQLLYLPDPAYALPRWSEYVPHIM